MHTMTTNLRCELDVLFAEIHHYLVAVDVFREQGYEPRWSSGELASWGRAPVVSDATPGA